MPSVVVNVPMATSRCPVRCRRAAGSNLDGRAPAAHRPAAEGAAYFAYAAGPRRYRHTTARKA
ncbi:hypothetical protein GCM10010361_40140 [Streptomyces olivaceiscleroticus]|uniref:Uncharacterized protein n=1 Tax=Streptomyces olivaceiscleroticus TaxID=68245 RepID=A0ABN1AAY6_9ACTN